MVERLKRLRERLERLVKKLRRRQEDAGDTRQNRNRLLAEKRRHRAAIRRRRNFYDDKFNSLPAGVDEDYAHKVKTQLLDLRKEFRETNEEIDDLVTKIERITDSMKARARRIRYITRTRLPRVRHKVRKAIKAAQAAQLSATGSRIVTFDGKPVPEWLAFRLKVARESGLWHGVLVSGYRTPEYSEQLCYNMCGAPSCPGRCAGRATNHAKHDYPYGAVDVSDYYAFGSAMRALSGRIPGVVIYNALGAQDPVHFSSSGR